MNSQAIEAVPLITLVGPPNSGKTTLFNYLSGQNYKTVNYPGATVEYSVSNLLNKFNLNAKILDSPGIISLIPSSPDEKVSIDALFKHPELGIPDVTIVTIDASQLSRHLLLAKQMIQSNFNVVIALTMCDILNRKGFDIDTMKLESQIGCKVIKVDGRTGTGTPELIETVSENLSLQNPLDKKGPIPFSDYKDNQDLIKTYREISNIENEVVIHKNGSSTNIDLTKVNKSLNIVDPILRKGIHTVDKKTLKIDRILLHRFWGIVTFFLIMSITFTSIFWLAEPLMELVDELFGFLSFQAHVLIGNNWFGDFISTGIISGTGSVMVFVPQIAILFLILGLLEDTGYLARGAMLIDKPLSKIGLNGKSFVPMLSGFACAIPAIMAARTIPNKRERLLTIFILPLMSCSARLPVYALLIAFLLPAGKSWIGGLALAAIYITSTISSILVASVVNKFKTRLIKENDSSSFILELPTYRVPKLSVTLSNTYTSSKIYLKKAGPIILTFSIVLWFLTYFPNYSPKVDTAGLTQQEVIAKLNAERLSESFAADLGKFIQPVMRPLGMDWRVGVSLIAAFTAREVFVSSLALIFKVTSDNSTLQESMIQAMRKAKIEGTDQYLFTPATITGLIVFFIFALQCLSTVAVSKKETGGWRIPILQLIIFTGSAYILTFFTVNVLKAFGLG